MTQARPNNVVKTVTIGNLKIGNHLPLTIIAGPCAMESSEICHEVAGQLKEVCKSLDLGLIFKTSFDKANRTSLSGKRGMGLEESLSVFTDIRQQYDLPTVTDIHTRDQVQVLDGVVDVLQIPAFLCRQTDLLMSAGQSGCAVNIKKGQFLDPHDMSHAVEKVESQGNERILLTERGTSFGYRNLVVDMRALPIMAQTGYPVVMDATHAVQLPGGAGGSTSGERRYASVLARAACAVGVAAVFVETHPQPDKAISDGANMIPISRIGDFLEPIAAIDKLIKPILASSVDFT